MNEQQNNGNIILYQTEDGKSRIEVTLCNDTVWLTADQMAELFQRNKSTISRHIKNVFEDGELQADEVVAFFATTTQHGAIKGKNQTHQLNHVGKISAELAKQKADTEYDKFKERTVYNLSPVEIHFLENFEKEQKKLKDR